MADIYRNVKELKNESFQKYLYCKKNPYIQNLLDILRIKHVTSKPIMIVVETINECNNNCIICGKQFCSRKTNIMSIELFDKVLRDYSDMGGGYLSLTPQVGEIFLDPLLQKRLEIIKSYPEISGISVTTNGILADKYDKPTLKRIINSFKRVHISIYGIDRLEYQAMTRRQTYDRMIKSVKKILEVAETAQIAFGFRFLKDRTPQEIENWMISNFNQTLSYGFTNQYVNLGGGVNTDLIKLPYSATWKLKKVQNNSPCIHPLFVCRIFSDGNVSFCGCVDFNHIEDFALGNLNNQSLVEIYNSKKNQMLWDSPNFITNACKCCTHYSSISEYENLLDHFKSPIFFIGG